MKSIKNKKKRIEKNNFFLNDVVLRKWIKKNKEE